MADAPTPEELQAKRDELAQLQRGIAESQSKRDGEAAEQRRRREYERLDREIEFAKQSQAILEGTPPSESAGNTPPDNSTVHAPPVAPSYTRHDDDENGE